MKRINNNLKKWIHLRLSETEHRMVMMRLSKSTARNLSQYLRDIIFERPIIATYRNKSQDDIVQQLSVLNQELNALGNNLNQITKRLHTLHPAKMHTWSAQFSKQADNILLKITEVKYIVKGIAERWLR